MDYSYGLGLGNPFGEGAYRMTSAQGMRVHPITKRQKMHEGTDYASSEGTQLYAPLDGKVTKVGYQPKGAGHYATICGEVNGKYVCTTMMHLKERIKAQVGTQVKRGQAFALSGNTGGSTGAHLHYTVTQDGRLVGTDGKLAGAFNRDYVHRNYKPMQEATPSVAPSVAPPTQMSFTPPDTNTNTMPATGGTIPSNGLTSLIQSVFTTPEVENVIGSATQLEQPQTLASTGLDPAVYGLVGTDFSTPFRWREVDERSNQPVWQPYDANLVGI